MSFHDTRGLQASSNTTEPRFIVILWELKVSYGVGLKSAQAWGCTLGYNDFNNLDMQTLWWLPNQILRHIFFWAVSCAFVIKVLQKVLIKKKIQKIQYGYQKTQNFTLISNQLKKFLKKCTIKKLLAKMWRKKALFSLFTHVRQIFFAYNFFWCIFLTIFSTDSKSAWNSAFFIIFSDFFQHIFLGHISTFCKL